MAIKGELILIKYILKSGIRMILLILAISIAAFFLMTISPIDPLQTNVGQTALGIMSQEQIEQLQMYWGTNENVVERYLTWIKDFILIDCLAAPSTMSDVVLTLYLLQIYSSISRKSKTKKRADLCPRRPYSQSLGSFSL